MSRKFPLDQAASEVAAEYRPGRRKRGLRGRPGLTAALVVLVLSWAFFGHFTLTLHRAELTGAQDEAKGAVQAAEVFFGKTLNQAGLVLDALVEDFWEHGANPSLHMTAMSERMLKRVPAALGVVLVDPGGRVLFSHPKPVAPDLSLDGLPDFSELFATAPDRLSVSSVGFCPIYQVPAFSVAQTMHNDEGGVVAAAKVVFSAQRLAERMSPLLPHLGGRLAVLDGRGRILTLAPYDETRLRDPSLADAARALPIGMERRTPGLSPPGLGKSDDFVAVGYKTAADGAALFVFADLAARLAEPRLAVYGYGLLGAASSLLVLGAGLLLDRAAGRRERLVRALEKSRAALIRRKRLFKSIIDLVPAALAWKDASGRILGGNKRFEQFCGAPLSALLGTREHLCDVTLAALDSRLDTLAIQGRSVRDVETVLDGRTYSTARAPLYDEAGRVSGLIFAALDVTDRIEAERGLAEALAELQSLFDTALVGVALLHDFSFMKLNEAAARFLGYDAGELVGKACEIVHVDALQYSTVHTQFAADFSQGRSTFIEEFPYRRKDGSIVYFIAVRLRGCKNVQNIPGKC